MRCVLYGLICVILLMFMPFVARAQVSVVPPNYWQQRVIVDGTITLTTPQGETTAQWGTREAANLASTSITPGEEKSLVLRPHFHFIYTWNGVGISPPDSVIIQKISSVSGSGPKNSVEGEAQNDLNSPPDEQVANGVRNFSSAGERYVVEQSGKGVVEFDLFPTVAVRASGTTASYTCGLMRVAAECSSRLIMPYLRLYGVTHADSDPSNHILIGQPCSGAVEGVDGFQQSNHKWYVPGQTFLAYVIEPGDERGYVVDVPYEDWGKPSPLWYWKREEKKTVTVSCWCDISYRGEYIGAIHVTNTVQIWPPYSKLYAVPHGVEYVANPDEVSASQNQRGIPGIDFEGAVGTPNMFLPLGSGQWGYLQICSLNRRLTVWGGLSTHTTQFTNWLDNEWTYQGVGVYYSADSLDIHPTPHPADDSPSEGLLPGYTDYSIHDTFDMYIMYMPPGYGCQWVPLKRIRWHWDAADSRLSGIGAWNLITPGVVTAQSEERVYVHPEWNHKFQ